MARGGKRPGAGRPATGQRFESISVALTPAQIAWLGGVAAEFGISISEVVRRAIDIAAPRFPSTPQ